MSPPGKLRVSPLPPAPSSESAFLTVCATWVPPLAGVEQGQRGAGWGGLLCRGVELGVNCIETSPKQGMHGAERPSPEQARPSAHALGQTAVPRRQDASYKVPATRPSSLATPRVSPQPSSALVASLPTRASTAASAARRWGPRRPPQPPRSAGLPSRQTPWRRPADIPAAAGTQGEVALLGVLPVGPGQGHRAALTWSWAQQQPEMRN